MLADVLNHLKDAKFDIIDATNGDYYLYLARATGTTADSTWECRQEVKWMKRV